MTVEEFNIKKIYSEASGVCAYIDSSITMQLNKYGLYEAVSCKNKNEVLNHLIEYVSPNLNTDVNESYIAKQLYENIPEIKYDERLGYYKDLYIGYALEGNYRKNASSGGIATWLFKELFEKGLVDGVIHVKKNVDLNSPILFKYGISRSIDEVKNNAKTKYYPLELSEVLHLVKENPGNYALIGIPSFIMAVRLLAQKDVVIRERIKFTIGLVCGHQKSTKFAELMAWQMGIKPGNLRDINFRYKLKDKPASSYGVEVTGLINGKMQTVVKPTSELVGQDWGQGFFKPLSSDYTDDVFNETADIVLGDAWLKEYTSDSGGNNILIVRNPIIHKIIEDGLVNSKLHLDKVDKEIIFSSQAAHYRHTHDELAYRLYKKDKKDEWRPVKRVDADYKLNFFRKKIQDLRSVISVSSHEVYKKAVDLNDLSYFIKKMNVLSKRYRLLYFFKRIFRFL